MQDFLTMKLLFGEQQSKNTSMNELWKRNANWVPSEHDARRLKNEESWEKYRQTRKKTRTKLIQIVLPLFRKPLEEWPTVCPNELATRNYTGTAFGKVSLSALRRNYIWY